MEAPFLLGNVDADGNLDLDDVVDDELRLALRALSTGRLRSLLPRGDGLSLLSEGAAGEDVTIAKAADAQDFADATELAEDDDHAGGAAAPPSLYPLDIAAAFARMLASGTTRRGTTVPQDVTIDALREHFPLFDQQKVLRFMELLAPNKRRRLPRARRPLATMNEPGAATTAGIELDEHTFEWLCTAAATMEPLHRRPMPPLPSMSSHRGLKRPNEGSSANYEVVRRRRDKAEGIERVQPVLLRHWEDCIIWDDHAPAPLLSIRAPRVDPGTYLPWVLDSFGWNESDDSEDSVSSGAILQRAPLVVDLNDPNMLFEMQKDVAAKIASVSHLHVDRPPPPEVKNPMSVLMKSVGTGSLGEKIDFYNLSNDKHYEFSKRSERVRHGVGRLTLRHSPPALRLDSALVKTYLNKKEIRRFHRPQLLVRPGTAYTFEAPAEMAKKKLKKQKKKGAQAIVSAKDVSLRQQSEFVLFEFSEENPPLIMNPGMATLIHNYYRKTHDKDPFVPEAKYGTPVVLESVDKSPFAAFGDIRPSQTMPVLFNSLFRAPLFMHTPPSTLFLVVMIKDKCIIHEIPTLILVGQTFPLAEVPTPNSRKAHLYVKQRIDAFITREFVREDNEKRRIPVDLVFSSFPFLAQANLRKKMRPIADVKRRTSDNVSFWYLKPGVKLPTEDELRKLMTPEMVCAYESMLFAQQRLKDFGYLSSVVSMEDNDDEDRVDDEIKLAPWRVTKNVINAFQGKGLLQLTGPGDPTGRGEGFSFIRVPSRIMHGKTTTENPIPKTSSVAGTDSDLRRMSVETAKQILRNSGMTEMEISALSRWKLIRQIRSLSNMSAQTGSEGDLRYARQSRFSLAEHKRAYNEDMHRIWNAQLTALSSKDDLPDVAAEEEEDAEGELDLGLEDEGEEKPSETSPTQPPAATPQPPLPQLVSIDNGPYIKKLRIERRVMAEDDQVQTEVEFVTDPRVIKAYLAARERQPHKPKPAPKPRAPPTKAPEDPQKAAERRERRRLNDQMRRQRKRQELLLKQQQQQQQQ